MATPPTVLANTSSAPAVTAPVPEPAKFPLMPVILAAAISVTAATACVGGGAYFLVRSGRLTGAASAAGKTQTEAPPLTRTIMMEPLLVNLADAGGSSYLRVALTLQVKDEAGKKAPAPKEEKGKDQKGAEDAIAPVRDTLLMVLGQQTSDELLAGDGKEHLKRAIKAALTEHNPDVKVTNVYFTDFLVQR